ncbi:MAG TPA: hypothetical protein VJN88_12905 [Ktedonobacterales bacterium]|nr:hypothetical protein [Ktedonobacterales bacterium]
MPDRFWWLRFLAGVALVATLPLIVWWGVVALASFDRRYGVTNLQEALGTSALILLIAGYAALLILSGHRAHRRYDWRQSALTTARLPGLPDVVARPGDTVVAINSRARIQWTFYVIGGLSAAAVAYPFGSLLLRALFARFGVHLPLPNVTSGGRSDSRFLPRQENLPGAIAFLLFFTIILLNWSVHSFRAAAYITSRMTATAEGMTRSGVFGGRAFIAWTDARLFETRPYIEGASQRRVSIDRYLLYGHNKVIAWREGQFDQPSDSLTPSLAAVVTARARLPTLDVISDDQAPDREATHSRLERHVSGNLTLVACMIATLSLVAGSSAFLPITLLFACVAVGSLLLLWPRTASGPAAIQAVSREGAAPVAIFAPVATATYALYPAGIVAYRRRRRFKVAVAFVVLCCAVVLNGLFFTAHNGRSLPGISTSVMNNLVFLIGVGAGVVMVFTLLRKQPPVLSADMRGLRRSWLWNNRFIPWQTVRSFTLVTRNGIPSQYVIRGARLWDVILWPARPAHKNSDGHVEADGVLITPDELAQVIAQRSGVALRVTPPSACRPVSDN